MFDSKVDLDRTAYQVLGVSEDASHDDIVKAHRVLMRKFHPDINPDADQDQAKAINEAFDNLKNDEARASYNLALRDARTPAAPAATTEPMSAEDRLFVRDESYVPAGEVFDFAQTGTGKRAFNRRTNVPATKAQLIVRLAAVAVIIASLYFLLPNSDTTGPVAFTWLFPVAATIALFKQNFVLVAGVLFGALIFPLSLTGMGFFTWFTNGLGVAPFIAMTVMTAAFGTIYATMKKA
ncbi:J domain-containing protein [Curtobacterium sp. MCSS17_016]|uniref:J domain-containing protein n=1 Tax=Curtobacterium sp. MCSS17_016 TaxID=2175644 RepID=UPI000DA9F901|nr:J domain-containing protein [Curtobacterium sp. MCSS17_016]WIE81516.1 J domain-containing protein [Curtobacterium sp. MCSS17_016]